MHGFADDDPETRLEQAIEAAERAAPDEALRELLEVRAELSESLERVPGSAPTYDDLARCVAAMARARARSGDPEAAVTAVEEAMVLRQKATEFDPLGNERLGEIASLGLSRSTYLCQAGRLDDALAASRGSALTVESLIDAGAGDGEAFLRFVAADARRQIAWLLPRMGEPEGELDERERALVHGRRGMELDQREDSFRAHAAALREVSGPRAGAGDLDGALNALREAQRVLGAAARREPQHLPWQRELATTRAWTGRVLRGAGRLDDAREELDAATFLIESLLSLAPEDGDIRAEYVRRLEEQGDLLIEAGDPEAAVLQYAARTEAAGRLLADDPVELGRAHVDVARAQRAAGRAGDAATELAAAVAAFSRAEPGDLNAREALADALDREAAALDESGNGEASLVARRRCVEVRRTLHRDVPAHDHAAHALIVALGDLGDALGDAERLDDAAEAHRDEGALARERVARLDEADSAYGEVAVAEASLASVLVRAGRQDEAQLHAAKAVEARRRAHGALPALARFLCWDLRRHALLLWALAQAREADTDAGVANGSSGEQSDAIVALLREAAQIADAGWATTSEDERPAWIVAFAAVQDALGDVLEARGDVEGALEAADAERAGAEDWATFQADDATRWSNAALAHEDAAELAQRVHASEAALGRFDDAVRARRRAVEIAGAAHLGVRRDLSFALYARAWCRRGAGMLADALHDAREALGIDRRLLATAPGERSFRASVAASLNTVGWLEDALGHDTEFEEAAREEVALRRRLASGDAAPFDRRQLGWALYSLSAALRDLDRAMDARAVAEEGLALAEELLAGGDDDLHTLGLLSNISEVAADVTDRTDADAVAHAARLYERNVSLHRENDPEAIGHDADCSCLVDNQRKLDELRAAQN